MWLFVFFDLPVELPKHKKAYAKFKRNLEKDGFSMMQYSVYVRHCSSHESAVAHIKKIERVLPQEGKISILTVTDKQFENIHNFWGLEKASIMRTPSQLELF